MGRMFKALVFLVVLALGGLVGYAYLGDMAPRPAETRTPVDLNAGY